MNDEKETEKKLMKVKIDDKKLSGKRVKQQTTMELEINEAIDVKKMS